MKLRGSRYLLVLAALVLLIAGFAFGFWANERHHRVDDLPGGVIGNNLKGIPESKLPQCAFDGMRFINTPCYSPPGSLYD